MSAVIHIEDGGRLVEVTLSGKLTREGYEEFLLEVEQVIQERGKLRMLCRLTDFRGWRLGDIWQEVRFDFQHFSGIERLALVGEKRWEAGMWMFCVPFTAASSTCHAAYMMADWRSTAV